MSTSYKKTNFKLGKFQEAWLQALESGKFRKAYGQLGLVKKGHKSYCCLGVACEVHNRLFESHKLTVTKQNYSNTDGTCDLSFNGYYGGLPDEVNLGLMNDVGDFISTPPIKIVQPKSGDNPGEVVESLIGLNDDMKWSHKKIAAFIRAYPECVFKYSV